MEKEHAKENSDTSGYTTLYIYIYNLTLNIAFSLGPQEQHWDQNKGREKVGSEGGEGIRARQQDSGSVGHGLHMS